MPAVRILADHMLIEDGARSALTTKKKVCRVSIEIAVCKEMISKKSVLQSLCILHVRLECLNDPSETASILFMVST